MLSRPAYGAGLLLVLLVVGGYILYPALETVRLGTDGAVLSRYLEGWPLQHGRALWNSVSLSLLTVLGSGVVGTLAAYGLVRYRWPAHGLWVRLMALPLVLPPLVGVLAFLFLYGESGMLPRMLQRLLELPTPPLAFEGYGAVLAVHIYVFYVYFYLFAMAAFRQLDGSLVEAAEDLGASGWEVFRDALWPQIVPALRGAGLIVFMLSMASFTAPLLFAGDTPFLTVQIYEYKLSGDLAMAAWIATLLTGVSLLFLMALEGYGGYAPAAGGKGTSRALALRSGGRGRGWFLGLGILLVLWVLLPVLTVVLLAFVQEGSWTTQVLPPAYTLDNLMRLFREPEAFTPIRNSLTMASMATAGTLMLGLVAALVLQQSRRRVRILLHALLMLPFAIPGTVIAVNLIVAFNRPTPLTLGQVLVGTYWMLPLAYFIRFLPFVVRGTTAALERLHPALLEASADLGAPRWATFRWVTLPLIAPGVLAGVLFAFVSMLGEFVASIMLYIYANRPISVEIFSRLRLYDLGGAAAYSLLLMGLVGLSLLVVRTMGGSEELPLT